MLRILTALVSEFQLVSVRADRMFSEGALGNTRERHVVSV
jgi:hypothetical protein